MLHVGHYLKRYANALNQRCPGVAGRPDRLIGCVRPIGGAGDEREAEENWGELMSDDYKIYVDPDRPSTLNDGAGVLTDYATLLEAVLAWRVLAPERKIRATIKVIGGPVYTMKEIDRSILDQSRRDDVPA